MGVRIVSKKGYILEEWADSGRVAYLRGGGRPIFWESGIFS